MRSIAAILVVTAACVRTAPPRQAVPADAALSRAVRDLVTLAGAADMQHAGVGHIGLATVPVLPTHYDAPLRHAWDELTRAVERWSGALPNIPSGPRLVALAGDVNAELERSRLDYYIDVQTTDEILELRGYRIEQRIGLASGPRRTRVLALRAIGPGFREELGVHDRRSRGRPAMIFLDRIDSEVIDKVLPVCADGADVSLAADEWAERGLARQLAVSAAAATCDDLRAIAGDGLARVASLAERRRHVDFNPDHARALAAIEAELARPEHRRVVRAVTAAFAIGIAVHEGQHALDGSRPAPLWRPLRLVDALAELSSSALEAQVADELSAMLAELAADQPLPRVTLWVMARRAFLRPRDSVHGVASALAIEALGKRFVDLPAGPVIHDGEIDRDRLVELALVLSKRSVPELRQAAIETWTELFNEPYARIERR